MSTEKFESTVMNIPASAWASGVAAEAYKVRARFVYNKGLALQMERKEKGENRHGYAALCKVLTDWRHAEESSFLAEAPTHALQQSLKDLDRAFVGHTCGENRKSQAKFACMRCGHIANADHNAAQNILAAGLAVIACGEKPMGSSMKQEPTVSAMLIA